MSEQPAPTAPIQAPGRVRRGFEHVLFNSRWLMAPFYVGLVVALAVLFLKFVKMLWEFILHAPGAKSSETILDALSLIDVTLVGNLLLIVVFSGYENFVSKIAAARKSEDRPNWMGHVDFSGLKMKLIGSIVAISAIGLLADFTGLTKADHLTTTELMWRVILHLTFVVSGLTFAAMDWLGEKRMLLTKQTHGHADESE